MTAANAALDYAAYMASQDVIRLHSDSRWPIEDFTFADDLELVVQHQSDHVNRRAFTFVLLTPALNEALGCVYVNSLRAYLERAEAEAPLLKAIPLDSAMITFWLRQDQQETGLADVIVAAVDGWLRAEWSFATHYFRVLPTEVSSCRALDRMDLRRITFPLRGERRPYVWYQSSDPISRGQEDVHR